MATDRSHREVTLLRGYCTRHLADVESGKLDVREAAGYRMDETGDGFDKFILT